MSPRHRYTFFIDEAQRAALTAIKQQDGIPESEQIRRAINQWLERRGVKIKPASRRAGTRRKA